MAENAACNNLALVTWDPSHKSSCLSRLQIPDGVLPNLLSFAKSRCTLAEPAPMLRVEGPQINHSPLSPLPLQWGVQTPQPSDVGTSTDPWPRGILQLVQKAHKIQLLNFQVFCELVKYRHYEKLNYISLYNIKSNKYSNYPTS